MIGRKVPQVILKTRVRDESIGGPNPFRWQDLDTAEIFRGRRVVVFVDATAHRETHIGPLCVRRRRIVHGQTGDE